LIFQSELLETAWKRINGVVDSAPGVWIRARLAVDEFTHPPMDTCYPKNEEEEC
jgi:hypothetical protein